MTFPTKMAVTNEIACSLTSIFIREPLATQRHGSKLEQNYMLIRIAISWDF